MTCARTLLAVLFLACAPSLAAQTVPADSLRAAARAAAERPSTRGHLVGGFVGGLLLGFGGYAMLANERPHSGARTEAGLGAVVLAGAATSAAGSGGELPGLIAERLDALTPAEREAFRGAYTARLRARRTRATLGGALAGTALGAAALGTLLGILVD